MDNPQETYHTDAGLLMLCFIAGFILLKIPAMTATLFSGHTGGHDAGFGVATAFAARGLIS